MTRKHYKELADALGRFAGSGKGMDTFDDLVRSITTLLKQDNPRFDRDRFMDAVNEALRAQVAAR